MSTRDEEETGMTERQAFLDFPGAKALEAAGRVEPPSEQVVARALAAVEEAVRVEAAGIARVEARTDARRVTRIDARRGVRGVARMDPRVKADNDMEDNMQQDVENMQQDAVVTPFRKRRRVLGLVAAAAVAAGAVATVASVGSGSGHATQAQSASAFLNNTAEVAAVQSAGSGKYWEMRTDHGTSYTSQSMVMTFAFPGAKNHREMKSPEWQLGTQSYDWDGLAKLTTDPKALLGIMKTTKQGKWEEDANMIAFEDATDLLSNSPASPELRAGLFKAVSQMKGVKVVGTVKDATGRSGTELTYTGNVGTDGAIIDPKTSRLLEIEKPWTSAKSDQRTTILSAGLTGSNPQENTPKW